MAIAAWDRAISSGVVGPLPANSRRNVSPPSTPSRTRNPAPSTPLGANSSTPSSAHNTLCSSSSSGCSVGPSSPSQGSASRLVSIINALEELGLESQEPFYVVLRGLSPGVYASRCVSTHIFVSSLTT